MNQCQEVAALEATRVRFESCEPEALTKIWEQEMDQV